MHFEPIHGGGGGVLTDGPPAERAGGLSQGCGFSQQHPQSLSDIL